MAYRSILTLRDVQTYLSGAPIAAFDFETAPDEPYRNEEKAALDAHKSHIVGISFSVAEGDAVYLPLAHRIGENVSDQSAIWEWLSGFFADPAVIKVAHNLAFESAFLYARGIVLQEPCYDTIAAAQLIYKNEKEFRTLGDCGLKTLVPDFFGEQLPSYADIVGGLHFDELDPQAEPTVRYACADADYIPRNKGKIIEMRKYDSLPKALTPLTEGVTPNGNNISVSTITAEVEQYGDWTRLSDMLELTAIDNNVLQCTKRHGSQAGRTLDTITRDILNGGTQVIYAPKKTGDTETAVLTRGELDATATLTPDLFFQASANLSAMNAPTIDGSYVAIIHPYAAYDLMRTDEWIDVAKYAKPDQYFRGEIGKIGNVRFVSTSEAKIWADATCPKTGEAGSEKTQAVFSTLVLGQGAYGTTDIEGGGLEVIVKQLGAGDDPLNQRSSVGWKATKTAERLLEEYMLRVESLSKYSDRAAAN